MNIEEYISSGIIESYVLGQLNIDESLQVEQMARLYPEVKNEINATEKAFQKYAEGYSVKPSPLVKEKLLSQINFKDESLKGKKSAKTIPINKNSSWKNLVIAASLTIAILSTGASVYFWQKWKETKSELEIAHASKAELAQSVNLVNQKFKNSSVQIEALNKQLAFLKDTNTIIVPLKGLPKNPNSLVLVAWNKQSQEVFVNTENLPTPPEGKQFQLWAIKEGTPVDAGVLELEDSFGLQKMKSIEGAQAFAITLENKGGSPAPTLEEMYVMGTL